MKEQLVLIITAFAVVLPLFVQKFRIPREKIEEIVEYK